MSPTTNTSGWPGSVRSGLTRDPAGPVERGTGLLGQRAAERVGLDAGRPDLGDGVDPLDAAVLELHLDAALVDVGHHRAEHHLDAELLELALGPWRRASAPNGGSTWGAASTQDHPGLAGVDRAEVLAAACGARARRSGRPSPRRSGRRRRRRRSAGGRRLAAGGAELGHLEGAEDPAAQLEGVVDATSCRARTRRSGRCRSRTGRRRRPRSGSRTA